MVDILVPGPGIAQVPPDEDWRTIETEHFRVTYPDELYELAKRAGERAERAHAALSSSFSSSPSGRIDLVLVDHVDFSNGFANVVPSNRITVYARPPVDGRSLGYFDDWMELVIVHELTHIFHLDRTRGLGRLVRGLVGRYPATWPFFPGRATPTWITEGIATYYESARTDAGRVLGTWQDMVLRTAALEGRLDRLDQASGQSPVWPAGQRPYTYGSEFLNYLVNEVGEAALIDFVDGVAGQIIPYRIDSAARKAFGVSFSDAWRSWTAEQSARSRALADALAERRPITEGEALTRGARFAVHPRVSPDGTLVAYARSDGRSDSQVRVGALDGASDRQLMRTNGTTPLSWTPDGRLVFAQNELTDPYRIRSDLYSADLDGGVTRLTRNQRLAFPDADPGGRRAVAVQEGGGTNGLVLVDLDTGDVRAIREARPDEHWSFPRWSPDGSWIAVSRWRAGGRRDIVLLDPEGGLVAEVTADRAVDVMPAWSPDGRTLLWSSDRTGIPNLFAADVDPSGEVADVRQVTNVLTGAAYPAVDPAGRWIYYSAYHHDGWDVERIPYVSDEWFEPFPTDPRFLSGGERSAESYAAQANVVGRPYRSFRSLRPTYWEPLLESPRTTLGLEVIGRGYGLATSGNDLVNRHGYSAWGRFIPRDGRSEGQLAYTFEGLANPALSVVVGQLQGRGGAISGERQDGTSDTLFVVERERAVDLSASFRRRRFRSFTGLTLSASHSWVSSELLDMSLEPSEFFSLARPTRRIGTASATVTWSTARIHAMSVSPENGVSGFIRGRAERVLDLPDEQAGDPATDDALEDLTGRLSLYKSLGGPGFARHVIALRASGGVADGPGANGFHFGVGGAAGRSETVTGFSVFGGTPLLFPVRGYGRLARRGRYAWSASAEYRFPLFLLRQGLRAWPMYLDRASASGFLDAGNAWGPEEEGGPFPSEKGSTLLSAGAELTVNGLPLWANPLDIRVGVGLPLVARDPELGREGPRVYVRLGAAF